MIQHFYYQKANIISDMLKEEILDYNLLSKKIFTFIIVYEQWLIDDKENQLNILCEIYYQYDEILKDFLKNNMYSVEIKKMYESIYRDFLNKILRHLSLLKKTWKKYLKNYKYKHVDFDEQSQKFMYNNLKNVYWDIMYMESCIKDNKEVIPRIINDYKILYNKLNSEINLDYLDEYKLEVKKLYYEFIRLNKLVGDSYPYPQATTKILIKDLHITPKVVFSQFKGIFNYLEELVSKK